MELIKIKSAFERLVGVRANLPQSVEAYGYRWIVGEAGDNTEYPIDMEDLERLYPVAIKYIKKNIFNDNLEKCAISVPLEYYYNDKLLGFPKSEALKKQIKAISNVDVDILPQGVMVLYVSRFWDRDDLNYVLVIDGGFNTVNISIIDKRDLEIKYVKTYYDEFGIRDLIENYFLQEISVKYPEAKKNLQGLKDAFLKERYSLGFITIDVSAEKKRALNLFLERLVSRVVKDIKRKGLTFESFIIAGGLSYYTDEFDTNLEYEILRPNGEFANAIGIHKHTGLPAIDFGFGDIKIVK